MELKDRVEKTKENDSKRFPKLMGLIEPLKMTGLVAATSFALVSGCGPTPNPGTDAGNQIQADAGEAGMDASTQAEAGPDAAYGSTLCQQYADGSQNRVTFTLGEVMTPAQNTDGFAMFFQQIKNANTPGDFYVNFGVYPTDLSSPVQYHSFSDNDNVRTYTLPKGPVTFQMCGHTTQLCDVNMPGGSKSGDVNCTATLASDAPFGN